MVSKPTICVNHSLLKNNIIYALLQHDIIPTAIIIMIDETFVQRPSMFMDEVHLFNQWCAFQTVFSLDILLINEKVMMHTTLEFSDCQLSQAAGCWSSLQQVINVNHASPQPSVNGIRKPCHSYSLRADQLTPSCR